MAQKNVNLAKEKAALENCYNELQVTHMDMEMQHEEQANARIASFLGVVVIPPVAGSVSIRGRQRCSLWSVLSQKVQEWKAPTRRIQSSDRPSVVAKCPSSLVQRQGELLK